jgi:hypothetical protein
VSDEIKDAAVAVLGLALLLGYAAHRAEHAIVHDLRRTVHGGVLRASVRPKGPLGLATGEFASVRVTGSGLTADDIPFRVRRGAGLRANADRLEFDFRDLTLRGTAVRRFTASFPGVSLDAGRALFDERIILRKAGEGTASAEVAPEALVVFINRKYPALTGVTLVMRPDKVSVRGSTTVLGTVQQLDATGRLVVRDERFLDLTELEVLLNGKPTTLAFAQNLARIVNPVVDFHKDLGLGDIFRAEEVVVGDGYAIVRGRARVPAVDTVVDETGPKKTEEKKP